MGGGGGGGVGGWGGGVLQKKGYWKKILKENHKRLERGT